MIFFCTSPEGFFHYTDTAEWFGFFCACSVCPLPSPLHLPPPGMLYPEAHCANVTFQQAPPTPGRQQGQGWGGKEGGGGRRQSGSRLGAGRQPVNQSSLTVKAQILGNRFFLQTPSCAVSACNFFSLPLFCYSFSPPPFASSVHLSMACLHIYYPSPLSVTLFHSLPLSD